MLTSSLYGTFDELWQETQSVYNKLTSSLEQIDRKKIDATGCYYQWLEFRRSIKSHILGAPKRNFLDNDEIQVAMVRSGMGGIQHFEIQYLNNSISQNTRRLIQKFKETDFHLMPKACSEFDCTTNSLGQLYYVARILETIKTPEKLQTIVEFGGGFGNLAHIFCTVLPSTTYIIFDVPEMLSLQYLYLKGSMPDCRINVIFDPIMKIEKNCINLIPSAYCDAINISTDLFVSTFALSETSELMQNSVLQKNYYNASTCYITGQLYEETMQKYVHHELIQNSVRSLYENVSCGRFHAPVESECTYELIATRA